MLPKLATGYTLDDLLLVPKYSPIQTRREVTLETKLVRNIPIASPVLPANMDTITGLAMAMTMGKLGTVGILHRFCLISEQLEWVKILRQLRCPVVVSIGIKEADLDRTEQLYHAGVDCFVIDVAHGHNAYVIQFIRWLKHRCSTPIIAGNVATFEGARDLILAGADGIKVGIGNGSKCTTRTVTGHGVPQATAIMECAKAIDQYNSEVTLIADGGIKSSGDIVKALALGADSVMIGNLFAGTDETPGKVVDGYKEYRGMASTSAKFQKTAMVDGEKPADDYMPEGIETKVRCKGPVEPIYKKLLSGIRSGLSYSGAVNISQLQSCAEFMLVTQNGINESLTRE